MFFGVDLGLNLGNNIRRNRETNDIDVQRNRARSKYGIPFASRWKVEVQNLARDISWQDLKDFCYNKTGVRPSRADINTAARVGTLCLPTEREMKRLLVKLDGVYLKGKMLRTVDLSSPTDVSDLKGKMLRTVDISERKEIDTSHSERKPSNRRPSDRHQNVRPAANPHRSDQIKVEHSKSDHRSNDRHRSERKKSGHASNIRNLDEPKVIIHQSNGDRVITERVGNGHVDEGHISENEQPYFKRDRRTGKSGNQGGSHGDARAGIQKRSLAVDKYGTSRRTKWRIRVENLSSEVSWLDLKDLIRPYADVRYADAHKPIAGIGNVHVSSEDGLHNVINKMNNSDLKGMIARFTNDSAKEIPVERNVAVKREAKRERSRSPHRKRTSKAIGSDAVKKVRRKRGHADSALLVKS